MKIAYLNKGHKETAAQELAKALVAKWRRRDRLKAEKEYGIKQIKQRS